MTAPGPAGVAETLLQMRGAWRERVELYHLSGEALAYDEHAGTPGASPFENLVYVDFDGRNYRQTNVAFKGRPLHVRSFSGAVEEGVLVFHALGPDAPLHIGVSGGPGILVFAPRQVDDAWQRYVEPDVVRLAPPSGRVRTTLLYRNGRAVRTLSAHGERISENTERRLPFDPRGADGPVHEAGGDSVVWREPVK